jgi:hypothetical protein
MRDLVAYMLAQTFEEKVGKFQKDGHSLLVTFRTRIDFDKEEGYRYLDLLLYGPLNYVGVYARERWNVISPDDLAYGDDGECIGIKPGKDYDEGAEEWRRYWYHDSTWRDGIRDVLQKYRDRITSFSGGTFYKVVEAPAELEHAKGRSDP